MTYKEFIIIYLSLISGLACTNIFYGISIIIKRWNNIIIDSVYLINTAVVFITIVDYWFHIYYFSYTHAKHNFFLFMLFLSPSTMIFFNTLIVFPRTTYRGYNYIQFFQKNLRINILSYGAFIFLLLLKIYIIDFKQDIFFFPLTLTLGFCIYTYLANTITAYKMSMIAIIIIHIFRWYIQGII